MQYQGQPKPRTLLHNPDKKVNENEIKNQLQIVKKKRLNLKDDDPLMVCSSSFHFHMFLFVSVMAIKLFAIFKVSLQIKLRVI